MHPPAAPLVTRGLCLDVWLTNSSGILPETWPQRWDGTIKAITGIAYTEGSATLFLGAPATTPAIPHNMTQTSLKTTATQSIFKLRGSGVNLTVDFLSPVEATDLKRLSMPLTDISVTAASADGATYCVSIYFDVNAEWASGNETVARGQFIANGVLANTSDTNQPRAINNEYPTVGFARALGFVGTTPSAPFTLLVGRVRSPAINPLEPVIDYASSGQWPGPYSPHGLGATYPNATGHNDGGENTPVEETANMLIMADAYMQRVSASEAATYANAHYALFKRWANDLLAVPAGVTYSNAVDPQFQNQTDDFAGPVAHSVKLALKGISGVAAFGQIAATAGATADATSYTAQAQAGIKVWAKLAQNTADTQLLHTYREAANTYSPDTTG